VSIPLEAPVAPEPTANPTAPRPGRRQRRASSLLAHGEPMLWLTGGSLLVCMTMILFLLGLVLMKGIGTFWPVPLVQLSTSGGAVYLGEVTQDQKYRPGEVLLEGLDDDARQQIAEAGGESRRRLLRTGNFELAGTHFNWVSDFETVAEETPEWALTVERQAWGRFYGIPSGFEIDGEPAADNPGAVWDLYLRHHDDVRERWHVIRRLETHDIGTVNARLEKARLDLRKVELHAGIESEEYRATQARAEEMRAWADTEFARLTDEIQSLRAENDRYKMVMTTADGKEARLGMADIVRAYPANQLGFGNKLMVYLSRWKEFLTAEPREANSEGGVYPAIFGTVLMTLLMSIAVVPYGVLAALYLREYAKAGPIVSAVRIAINNLAGVPSIVFGVFGLGFFCYGLGSYIDGGPVDAWPKGLWAAGVVALVACAALAIAIGFMLPARLAARTRTHRMLARLALLLWIACTVLVIMLVAKTPFFSGFYEAQLPNPTFGKGALIWASLTLALLTLPVVIVATEEALSAVPNSMREGSYACGASKWQTIRRIVLPRAMPGIMTGMILAMARGAGEVAPLMLVGAVKLAPELPVAWAPPFGMNRSFMHLGFHIFDLGFQSQNSEAAKPMVFTTTLLLILLIALMNLSAIWLRSRLRKRFEGQKF
jgi:ABC-type phosphate transport system permease subunit/ABC-type phosphate transport system auxiliary subunit